MLPVLVLLLSAFSPTFASIDLFKGTKRLEFQCSAVDFREPFSCYCLESGLWRVYKTCSDFKTVGIQTKACFFTDEQVKKVEQIAHTGLTVIGRSGSREFRWQAIELHAGDQLVTQTPKTISDGKQTICIANEMNKDYCAYNPGTLITVVSVEDGCRPGVLRVAPTECFLTARGLSSCADFDTTPKFDLAEGAKRLKRMFKPNVNATPYADDSDVLEDDEDYYKDDGKNKSSLAILTEVWNYYDRHTDILLGLRDKEYEYQYSIPVFQILQMSLEIMKKTCPPHYVPPGFLSLSVNSFIQLIRKQKFFTEYAYMFEGMERIKVALQKCDKNMTFFPFLEFQMDPCNATVIETGTIELYGTVLELNITQNMTSWSHEPIIDTAYKVFTNTHLRCFEFFDPIYNDHHRYAVLIETLFKNDVWDIWMQGETRDDLFGGMMGKSLIELTNRVAYCAASASLETTFPWDIPRPFHDDDQKHRLKRSLPPPDPSTAAMCAGQGQCQEFETELG